MEIDLALIYTNLTDTQWDGHGSRSAGQCDYSSASQCGSTSSWLLPTSPHGGHPGEPRHHSQSLVDAQSQISTSYTTHLLVTSQSSSSFMTLMACPTIPLQVQYSASVVKDQVATISSLPATIKLPTTTVAQMKVDDLELKTHNK